MNYPASLNLLSQHLTESSFITFCRALTPSTVFSLQIIWVSNFKTSVRCARISNLEQTASLLNASLFSELGVSKYARHLQIFSRLSVSFKGGDGWTWNFSFICILLNKQATELVRIICLGILHCYPNQLRSKLALYIKSLQARIKWLELCIK